MADLKSVVVYWAVILIAISSNNVEATKSKSSSHEVDICTLPPKQGPCEAATKMWYYNYKEKSVWSSFMVAVKATLIDLKQKDKCENTCPVNICLLPLDPGPCKGSFPRWYFNEADNKCLEFIYGGCKGNKNRFATQEECDKACPTDICMLPVEVGPCEALIPRWFYNAKKGECTKFFYGGCEGNENNFNTKKNASKLV